MYHIYLYHISYIYICISYVSHTQNVKFLLNYTFGSMFGIPKHHFRQTFWESMYSLIEKRCPFLKQNWFAVSTNFSLSTCFL